MNKKIIITCDTESLLIPQTAEQAHTNIFGAPHSSGFNSGIEQIIDVVDSVSGKVIFFYDVFTEYSCPGINNKVFDYILSRGHYVELHVHVEHLDDRWWADRGYKKPTWAANYYDDETAELVYSDALRLYYEACGYLPNSFRAGAWRYNSNILKYLGDRGVKFSFNYHPLSTIRQSFPHGPDAGLLDVFRWSNGMIEVPTATILGPNKFSVRQKYFAFENHLFKEPEDYTYFVNKHSEQVPENKYLTLVMHSWSLSKFSDGLVIGRDDDLINSFSNFVHLFSDQLSGSNILDELEIYTSDMVAPLQFAGLGTSRLVRIS